MTNIENNKSTQISSLQAEGQALTKAVKTEQRSFAKSIKNGGLDYRIGNLIKQIKAIENVSFLSKTIKDKYNFPPIDRRRTSESEWLIEHSETVSTFIKKVGFKGTNIGSLQNAMRKHYKDTLPSQEQVDKSAKADKPKTDAKASKTVSKETETTDDKSSEVSHIGQFQVSKKKLSANDLAFEMLVQAEKNSIPTKELLLALKEQIELLSTEEVA